MSAEAGQAGLGAPVVAAPMPKRPGGQVDDQQVADQQAADQQVADQQAARQPVADRPVAGQPVASEDRLHDMLQAKLQLVPTRPGVYIFKNAAGEPIYVGKAVSLRSRMRSYFQSPEGQAPKVRVMVSHIADFDYIVTESEVEALILEANLIKQERPRYNIRLRDDKAYPYLKVTLNEPFPRIVLARRVHDDGARYFGPFTNVNAMRTMTDFLRKLFPVRTCTLDLSGELNYRPCLLYHIERCGAPCAGKVSPEEYDKVIEQACLFLEGRHDKLLPELREQMEKASKALEFERAARIRDQIFALESVAARQKVVNTRQVDHDLVGLARQDNHVCVQVFYVRDGRLIGREHFMMEAEADETDSEIMTAFVKQYYRDATFVPREILLQVPIDDAEAITAWLRERRGALTGSLSRRSDQSDGSARSGRARSAAVHLHVPQRGEKRRLIEMVVENAELTLRDHVATLARRSAETEKALTQLADVLSLPDLPRRIEAFDISNIQGSEAVASMVVFADGQPRPQQYRRFKIYTKETPDDYAMMREVIDRRFRRGLREQADEVEARGFAEFPDLVLIDGGKGQLNAARDIMRTLGVDDIPAVGLAEGTERVFVEDESAPVDLPWASPGLKLLQRIRDEAHRYALTYHRHLRSKSTTRSVLDDIPGVGPRRKRELIRRFGSVAGIRRASVDEIASVPGISKALAERIMDHVRV